MYPHDCLLTKVPYQHLYVLSSLESVQYFQLLLTLRPFLFSLKIADNLAVFMACYGDKTRILYLVKER